MSALYRTRYLLPSLVLAGWLTACDTPAPPQKQAERPTNVYAEALKEAEATKQNLESRNLEQKRIDELLGRNGTTGQ